MRIALAVLVVALLASCWVGDNDPPVCDVPSCPTGGSGGGVGGSAGGGGGRQ